MARKPKVNKKEQEQKNELVTALEFVCLNQRDEGTPGQTNCIISNNQIVTYDGIIALGYPIENNLEACPQSKRLLAGLQRVAGAYSLTQSNPETLVLQAGRLRVAIPCLDLESLPAAQPDAFAAILSDDWRRGLYEMGSIASETATKVEYASVLIKSGSMLATDGVIALEYWHGLSMPQMVVPKTFINILQKIKYKIHSFGFSSTSFTIYFENQAWIKTQLYQDSWPIEQLDKILSRQVELHQLPFEFEDALDAVLPFSEGNIIIKDNKIQTHKENQIGASFDIDINHTAIFDPKKLKQAIPYMKRVNFCTDNGGVALFYGDNVRGALCQKVLRK